ncbi:caspase family protein [Henriciella sp.]|uniref:caspase family protein n=1 Tax=Henriciella sp. TaxID=1968823 RepID=UPI0026230B5B|nr:caspase family protein [Henriciella sp.]
MRVAFILCLIWCLGLVTPATAQRIATIIGNSDYTQRGWDLPNPASDARLVAAALEAVGFETEVLTDLGESDLEAAFIRHGQKLKDAGQESVGFFYYAGHAIQSEGLNYLIPVDAAPRSEADVWAQAPRLGQLVELLSIAGNQANFIVLDACRDNPMPMSVRSGGGGLAAPERVRGTLIAYATAPGKTASDGLGANSPYSAALATYLVQPGLAAETMFRRVATRVERDTKYTQQPWTESGLRGETDFCFAGCDETVSTVSAETVALQLAMKSNSADLLDAFLRSYPKAASRSLVEARVEELRALPGPARTLRIEAAVDTIASPDALPVDMRMLRAIISRLAQSEQDIDKAILKLLEEGNLDAAIKALQAYYDDNEDALGPDEKRVMLHQIGAFAADADMPVAREAYEALIDVAPSDYYAHLRLIRLARFTHDIGAARRYLERARTLSPGRAEDSIFLDIQDGTIRVYEDKLAEASEILLDAAERAEAAGLDRLESQARTNAALSFAIRGEHETAREMLEELMPWQRQRGFDRDFGVALSTMGNMALLEDRLDAARPFFEAYVALEEATGRPHSLATGYRQLASIDLKLGHADVARAGYLRSLELSRDMDSPVGEFFSLLGIAETQSAAGQGEAACETVARAGLLYGDDMRVSPSTVETIKGLGCPSDLIEVSALD